MQPLPTRPLPPRDRLVRDVLRDTRHRPTAPGADVRTVRRRVSGGRATGGRNFRGPAVAGWAVGGRTVCRWGVG
ncbi:hypothetical protein, partial [Actinomadura sp. GC306]|uniref:hypothetical protein n=1 Tax=Actinomadura sp. GC306 TaxID=2530367 RepID=UPI001A9D9A10